jgi:hypothetical protein
VCRALSYKFVAVIADEMNSAGVVCSNERILAGPAGWEATFFSRGPQEREIPRLTLFARDELVCREKRILLVAFSLRPWSDRRFFDASRSNF